MDARSCPGCGAAIPPHLFACRRCWGSLPPPVRRSVNLAWRRLLAGEDGALVDYRRVTAEAAALLGAGGLGL